MKLETAEEKQMWIGLVLAAASGRAAGDLDFAFADQAVEAFRARTRADAPEACSRCGAPGPGDRRGSDNGWLLISGSLICPACAMRL